MSRTEAHTTLIATRCYRGQFEVGIGARLDQGSATSRSAPRSGPLGRAHRRLAPSLIQSSYSRCFAYNLDKASSRGINTNRLRSSTLRGLETRRLSARGTGQTELVAAATQSFFGTNCGVEEFSSSKHGPVQATIVRCNLPSMADYKQIFDAITSDPRYQRNLDWGDARPGHPEATVRAHIAEVDRNLEMLTGAGENYGLPREYPADVSLQ